MFRIFCCLSILLYGLESCGGVAEDHPRMTWNMMQLTQEIEWAQQKGFWREALDRCQGQRIEVVGFLHKTREGQLIMTSQAVIKSCCLTDTKQSNALFIYPQQSLDEWYGLCRIEGRLYLSSLDPCCPKEGKISLWECRYKN